MHTLLTNTRHCLDAWLTRTRQPHRFTSANVVSTLEAAWAAIRQHHRQVPPAVIVVAGSATSSARHNGLIYGHFAALRWQHHQQRLSEVLISGEGLNRGAEDVLATLLHEAAHALAFARGIKDTSRQGRWHNQRFAELAGELGLHVSKDPKLGWSPSRLRPETAEHYADTLTGLESALTAYRHPEPAGPSGTTTNPSSLACICDCPRRIRLSPSVLEQGPITCGICDNEFTPDT